MSWLKPAILDLIVSYYSSKLNGYPSILDINPSTNNISNYAVKHWKPVLVSSYNNLLTNSNYLCDFINIYHVRLCFALEYHDTANLSTITFQIMLSNHENQYK